MRYNAILFDADETLLDFFSAEKSSLKYAFESFGLPYDETVHLIYHEINKNLWHEFSMGRIDKPTLTVKRFSELFARLKIEADATAFKKRYESRLALGFFKIPGAEELLKELRGLGCSLYCVTNGLKNTQFSRLEGSGLSGYFEKVFVSEEVGSQKPDKAYFEYVFKNISEKDKSKILLIGDSLTTDIRGGVNSGIDTVWYNPNFEKRNAEDSLPTFEIHSLEEIPNIVKG